MTTGALLPRKLLQINEHDAENLEENVVLGRVIHLRDNFAFSRDRADLMEHDIIMDVREASLLRASIHDTSGIEVGMRLVEPEKDWNKTPLFMMMKGRNGPRDAENRRKGGAEGV